MVATGSLNQKMINQGVLIAEDSETPLTLAGLVSGRGSYVGPVVFMGGFSPGNSPAAVKLDDAVLGPSNTLIMELGGVIPGTQYDQLVVGNHLSLGGNLDVELLYGFEPSAGDCFELIAGNFSGQFSSIALPPLDDGLTWDTSQLYSKGALQVVPEPGSLGILTVGAMALLLPRSRINRRV
jgi:hypothetical protein